MGTARVFETRRVPAVEVTVGSTWGVAATAEHSEPIVVAAARGPVRYRVISPPAPCTSDGRADSRAPQVPLSAAGGGIEPATPATTPDGGCRGEQQLGDLRLLGALY